MSTVTATVGDVAARAPHRREGRTVSAYDDILGAMPVDDIARQVGASPDEVRQAASAVLPALMGGLQANAQQPSGAQSLAEALGQHDPGLLEGGASLSSIDEQDGRAIAAHIFGDQQDAVAQRLGESTPSATGGGGLESVLQDVLGSATGGSAAGSTPSSGGIDAGSIIGDVLGGLLGGGRR